MKIIRILFFLAFVLIPGLATAQTLIFSPQRVTGWEGMPHQSCEYKTEFWALNLTQNSVSAMAIFTDQHGVAVLQTVALPDGESKVLSVCNFDLKANGSKLIGLSSVPFCSEELSTGTIAFLVPESVKTGDTTPTPDIGINVIYKRIDPSGNVISAAGVPVGECLDAFSLSAQINDVTDTGFALFNANTLRARIMISLIFEGQTVAVTNLELRSGEQIAKYIGQMFPDNKDFSGHVEFRSDQKLAVTALKLFFSPGIFVFAGMPVTPIK